MKKTFDAVEFMRRRREEIDAEDAGLTWEERTAKTRALLKDDPLWQRLQHRIVVPGGINMVNVYRNGQ